MKIGTYQDVEVSYPAGPENEKVLMRVLIGEEEGAPNFVMRHFELLPGGSTPYHSHAWEHEVYVLSGQGKVNSDEGSTPIGEGSFVYVAPEMMHNFSASEESKLEFICVIPGKEKCGV